LMSGVSSQANVARNATTVMEIRVRFRRSRARSCVAFPTGSRGGNEAHPKRRTRETSDGYRGAQVPGPDQLSPWRTGLTKQ
jgi:hypothetical protein